MDVFLIIIVCVIGLLLMYVNIYLLALYCHPEDGGFGASLYCKIVVVLGLSLSWCQVLMLALDVANERSSAGLDMKLCWMIIYISVFVALVFFIPSAIFYYESDEEKPFCQRLGLTVFQEFMVLVFAGLAVFLSYYWLQTAEIPIEVASVDADLFEESSAAFSPMEQQVMPSTFALPVSVITFTVGLMCFLGYFALVLYGGVGMTALPIDLIVSYQIRPVFRSSSEAMQKKIKLKQLVKEYLGYAQQLKEMEKDLKFSTGWFSKRSKSSQVEKGYTKLLKAVQQLEEEYEIFRMEMDIQACNPCVYILKLLLGVALALVTVAWWIHLVLFTMIQINGRPYHPFLNRLFIELDAYNVSFVSVFFFGLFTLYLLWSTTKGNIVFNLPWIFSFHPMKVNETWMNSFLFNIMLILFASVALTHFSTSVFSQYTRLTTVELLFGTQIRYLVMFKWAFANKVFEYALFGWSVLAGVGYLGLSCRKPSILKEIEERKKKLGGETYIELQEQFLKK